MRQINFQQKMEVIDFYLKGFSTNDIVDKSQISKGAVVAILKDAREGKFPGLELKDKIDELHALAVRLKKETLDLKQARLGFTFMQRLLDLDIEPNKLSEWMDFCAEISPTPPEGFMPSAMELVRIQKTTGKSYGDISSEVKELSSQRETLVKEVTDLKVNEAKAKELRSEIPRMQEEAQKLSMEKDKLEDLLREYISFIGKRAEKLGMSPDELEKRFKELISLEDELSDMRSAKNKLAGEIEALNERREKLSAHMELASLDFQRDIKLIRDTRDELTQIAEMKGKYEQELEDMEWVAQIYPFLHYPDKVNDPDFELAAVVVGCIDKWLPTQNLGFPGTTKWGEIMRHVRSKRANLG